MIPILYDKTGNTKITNLTDCIQCIVTEERNGMFEAELVYSVHSSNSDKLIRGNIIVADANDTLKEQKFRIYKISKPINGRIKILARHISFDMARDIVTGLVIDNQSCEYALNKLFSSSQFSQHFTGHSDIVNSQSTVINGTTHILKAIVGVEGSIIDTFGTSPEILRDNYDFYIYENRGHDNGVTIEYGKNLTGLNLDTDDSNMITRIRAIAKYRDENQEEVVVVSNPEFIDSPYINNYETPFIAEIDFSNHFKDDDVPTPIRLKTLAENYFTNNKCDLPNENATLSFIPLSKCVGYEGIQDKISLCDTVTVIDYRYNLTTKVKVIKVSYNTLKERYENMEVGEPRSRLGDIISNSMNSVKGEKGEKGDKGEPGAPGNIGDFPDALPTTPILTSSLYGFASIELSWTFESQPYYTYELYASRTENFTPNEFDLLFEGKGSTFLFQAKPNETWYFRVRAVNSHGRATNFSSQVTVTTTKIDDLSNYVENAAIGDALIGTLTLDRGWVGTLKGNYIDAKQLSVTDGNGKRTLFIDSFGNVSLNVTELKISSKQPATTDDLENLKGEINENLDNIEIGGKNYVKNYNFARKNYAWLCAGTGVVDTENQWGKMTTNTGASQIYQEFKNGEFKNGDVLTIQYEMKCDNIEVNTGSQSFNFAVYLTGYAADGSTYVDEVARFYNHNTDYTEYSNWKKVVSTCTVSSTKEYPITKLRLYCRNFKGDIYFRNIKIERGNKATDISPAPEDTEAYTDNLIYDLQEQLDGKIQTYSQPIDPSTDWTATEKANHEGDIWYNTDTKNTYRWSGTVWVLLQNAEAQSAKEIAQTKAQVFTGTPTTPYYIGDLWITALDGTGVVKTCITTRTTGNYISSDWAESLKYTDNTAITNFINNTYANDLKDVKNQIDGKATTYYQTSQPHPNYTNVADNATYNTWVGDLWYNSTSTVKKTYIYTKTTNSSNYNYQWKQQEIPTEIFDTIDGKKSIYVSKPNKYSVNDLWILENDTVHTAGKKGEILTCTTTATSYNASHWVKMITYTDDTFANQLKSEIDKLSFGSRNYFRYGWTENNSVKENLSDYWTSYQGSFTRSNYTSRLTDDYNFCLSMAYDSQYTYCNANLVNEYRTIEIPQGTKVTLSMYLIMTTNCKGYTIRAINDENTETVEFTDIISGTTNPTGYKISKTFNIPYNKTSIRIYNNGVKDTSVTTSSGLFFNRIKLEKGDFVSGYSEAPEDTQGYVDNLVADLQDQIDGKIETYSQQNDPSTNWTTTELKTQHTGDIWYNTSAKLTYRWSGTAWVKLSSQEAIDASDLANSKAQVFTAQPTVPYKKGDLWVTALDGTGIVKTCVKDRITGEFTESEWVENLKYTGDDLANEIKNELDNLTIGGRNLVKNSAFLLGEGGWTFGTNVTLDTSKTFNGHPSVKTAQSDLTANSYRGAITYNLSQTTFEKGEVCTISCYYYVEDKSTIDSNLALEFKGTKLGETQQQSSAIASYLVVPSNIVEGSWTRIYKTFTMPYTYEKCCIRGHLVKNGTAWFTDFKVEKSNRVSDWSPAPEDTNNIIDDAIKDLPTIDDVGEAKDSAIIASKIETIKQSYNVLKSEYNKNIQQSEIIYKNSYLAGTAKTNLNTAITNYKTAFTAVTSAHDSIVNANTITTSQANAWNTAITNIQTSTDTLAKRVQEAQTYIDTAIYNASVNYTNQAIPDALTGYAKTSYVDDAMEQAVNDAKDGMVSSTDLTINNTEILMSAASMGQYNLLRNTDFRNGFDSWNCWGMTSPHYRVITTSDSKAMNGENNACIYSNSATVGNLSLGNSQDVVLKSGSTYTISYWVNSVNSTMRAQIENYDSNNEKTVLAVKTYININGNRDRNTWKFDSITFTTPSDSSKVRVIFSVTNCTNAVYKALLVKPMLVSGNKAQAWTGHPDEIYVGVVSITEKKGLMVEHSNVNTKTIMSADGFSIEDNNGDVLAWLSSKDQWTELKADKIFAGNIENIYTGDGNLYVDHSATVAGDGTVDKPFNSFAQLKTHLEENPVINKDLIVLIFQHLDL